MWLNDPCKVLLIYLGPNFFHFFENLWKIKYFNGIHEKRLPIPTYYQKPFFGIDIGISKPIISTQCDNLTMTTWLISSCRYSWDEGHSWYDYQFSKTDKYLVYGLLTEPGEKTTIFTLFASKSGGHSWVVIQVDFKKFLGKDASNSLLFEFILMYFDLFVH